MQSKMSKDFDGELADTLKDELEREVKEAKTPNTNVADTSADTPVAAGPMDSVTRLPRRIAGGFAGVGDDLDRRARDWRNTYRLMEQQRPLLEAAESERDRLHAALEKAVDSVKESNRVFKDTLQSTKDGDISSDLAPQFNRCLNGLDELESVAAAMTVNMMNIRTCWEQYARTIIRAQKMREELRETTSKMPPANT